jgi:hypothetical protein
MRDDLIALWRYGGRLLVLRAGPEDLPYSPALTWIALGLMASIYPTWMLTISEPPEGSVLPGIGFAFGWTLVSLAGLLGMCIGALRVFGYAGRFHQFALALALVHGFAMAVILGSVLMRMTFVGPDPVESSWRTALALGTTLLPTAALLWYGLAMSHVWARTLDRGYGVGLLMTLLQNAVMWVVPVLLLIAYTTLFNLFT